MIETVLHQSALLGVVSAGNVFRQVGLAVRVYSGKENCLTSEVRGNGLLLAAVG